MPYADVVAELKRIRSTVQQLPIGSDVVAVDRIVHQLARQVSDLTTIVLDDVRARHIAHDRPVA